MSTYNCPTEGGSGGKRGHSNMEHWAKTEEIKKSSKIRRRNNSKKDIISGIKETKISQQQL